MSAEHAQFETKAQEEFLVANISVPYNLMLRGDIPAHATYFKNIGADGMEYTPMCRGRMPRQILRRLYQIEHPEDPPAHEFSRTWVDLMAPDAPVISLEEKEILRNMIRGGHSGFVDPRNPGLMGMLLEDIPTSLKTHNRLQLWLGQMPGVVYGDYLDGRAVYKKTGGPHDVNVSFNRRSTQPQGHGFAVMGLSADSPAEEIEQKFAARGIDWFRWDDVHAQIGFGPDKSHELLEKLLLAGLVDGTHVSLGRIDLVRPWTKLGIRTIQARRAFIKSYEAAAKTHEGESLTMMAEAWKGQPVDFTRPITLEDGPVRPPSTRSDQQRIMDTIRTFFR